MSALKFIPVIVAIGLLGYIAYFQFAAVPLSSKQVVEEGLAQVRTTQKLDAGREQLLRLQLAITDYIANHGTPPDDLEALIPDYFDAIPVEPKSGQPFSYLRQGNAYKLGREVTQPGVATPSAADKKEGTGGEAASQFSESFVNPNTMLLEDFIYDATGKRDPFMPFDLSRRSALDESIPPLERYEIGQLKVTAIASDGKGNYTAMVEDQTGHGYPVRVGTKIGNANGVVVSMERDKINVVETNIDITGQEQKKAVVIKLDTTGEDRFQTTGGTKRVKKKKR